MKQRIEVHSRYLIAVVDGPYALEEAKQQFLELIEATARHKLDRVLFDGRGVTGEVDPRERYLYARFIAETIEAFHARGVHFKTRFAYVMLPPILDPDRLGEGIAKAWGANVKAFDNLEGAAQWLEVPVLVRSRPDGPA